MGPTPRVGAARRQRRKAHANLKPLKKRAIPSYTGASAARFVGAAA
jgi:hypothetical protein